MERKRLSLLTIVLCICTAQAQNLQHKQTEKFLIGKFWDNWFISAGAGANLFIGDYNPKLTDHITPAVDLSLGKWFSPSFGLRLQYNGFSMKSTDDASSWYIDKAEGSGLHDIKFNYSGIHTNFLVNLSTAIAGYNPERRYEVILFGGLGWSQSSVKNDNPNVSNRSTLTRNELFYVGGINNKLRVSNAFDINLELRAVAVSQRLAGHMTGGSPNVPLSATAGFTYHFGGKNARKFGICNISNNGNTYLPQNPINSLTQANANLEVENKTLTNQPVVTPEQSTLIKIEKVVEKIVIPVPVFFELDKWTVDPREVASLKYIADYISENPKLKFIIKGYADSQTGSQVVNKNLSSKRAEALKKVLLKKYGINANQLQIAGEGGVALSRREGTTLTNVSSLLFICKHTSKKQCFSKKRV